MLRHAADAAAGRAYAPYSGLRVGAAGLCQDGHVVSGCNVENASFGLTLCAECGLVSALVAGGRGRLVAVSVTAGDGRPLPPCGRCRQLLMEHGGAGLLIDGGPTAPPQCLGDLLPYSFDSTDLEGRRAPEGAAPQSPVRAASGGPASGPAGGGPAGGGAAGGGPAASGPASGGPAGPNQEGSGQ